MLLALGVEASASSSIAVSQLEAIHVAEIHTGGVARSVELTEEDQRQFYDIHTATPANEFRVRVDGHHGRLVSIARKSGTDWNQVYQWPGIRVVAHRGGAFLGPPENTLPAIRKAIEIGSDLIEIDIRQTSDGHLVLMHDQTVDRMTNGKGRVDQLTLEEIRRLEVQGAHGQSGQVVRVPTLEEALLGMRGNIDPDLDFKDGDLNQLIAVVRRAGLVEQSTLCGPWELCQSLADLEPGLRIRPTAEHPHQVPDLIRQLRPAIVNLDWHAVTEEAVRLAHLGGCHAFVNCLGSADTEFYIRLAISIGADYIQSDQPDLVIRILKELGLRQAQPPRGDALATPLRDRQLTYPLR